MNETKTIQVKHVTRVEGHGNIDITIKDGQVQNCQWKVVEAPRFFEAMVRGRKWFETAHITSRICGICSIGHTLTSLKATEKAMDIAVSKQTENMRKLLLHAENIQSHILHVGYLVLPDLLGAPSVFPLASSHRNEVLVVVRLHQLSNEMSDLIGGRTTHPQRPVVGGFTKWPTPMELKKLRARLEDGMADLDALVELVRAHADRLPHFERETEFIALKHPNEYAFYDGDITSTDGGTWPVKNYPKICNEFLVPQSTAKFSKHNRESYMVGALARLNNSYQQLSPKAKAVAEVFSLQPVNCNPFMNNVAQIVEIAHCLEDGIQLIDAILADGIVDEQAAAAVKAGKGAASVEVPRGILFHEYEYDDAGICTWANCVIPTNQNHGNIQKDFESLVPQIKDRSAEEIELTMEMLVRAYDPCISCSTHCIFI
ncbi:MAG TPA: Ni/Fe hydrogenase subunit alpha [Desulfosalsimonadaceae bacterium]|nr:Ni/Fe hydrogenase subunit alpha [Desulfosalsimonadaceae bacterium]